MRPLCLAPVANLSHMAQWESARLEAEARLARESKQRSSLSFTPSSSASASTSAHPVLKPWKNVRWLKSTDQSINSGGDLESPKSTLTLSENAPPIMPMIEFVGTSGSCEAAGMVKEEGDQREWNHSNGLENSMSYASSLHHELTISITEGIWTSQEPLLRIGIGGDVVAGDQGFNNLLLNTNSDDRSLSEEGGEESNNWDDSNVGGGGAGSGILCEDDKNYWNSILNLVNSNSPPHSLMF